MSESLGDQRHDATPNRRQKARSDGDLPKSIELATAIQMLGFTFIAYLTFHQIGLWLKSATTSTWESAGSNLSVEPAQVTSQMQSLLTGTTLALLPVLGFVFLIGWASHWLQSGPIFLSNQVFPDINRLGPGNWKRQTFSWSGIAFLIVGIPKTIIAGLVLGTSVYVNRMAFFELANYSVDQMIGKMFALVLTVTFHVGIALLIASAADYGLKFASYLRRIRMTDQELRDELRSQNGSGQVRNRQRELNRV